MGAQEIGYIYCGISFLCAFVLFRDAIIIRATCSKYSPARFVFFSYVFAGLMAIFDCAFALREINDIVFHPVWSYSFTLAYVIFANLTGTFWIIYAEYRLNSFFSKTKKRLFLFMVPMFALILLTLSTPFTHLFFFFEDNTYCRGSLFIPISSLLLVYVAQNGVKALIRSLKKENYAQRHDFRRLFAYAFVYLLIQVVQLKMPSLFPYRSVGMMLIFDAFLVYNMKEMIGIDALTHISNRYAADRHLGELMEQGHDFEIAILDVDRFKTINDKYGHVEGDKALTLIAEALKEATPKSCFFARFGGDEFFIANGDKHHSICDIEEKVNQSLASLTEKYGCGYSIVVSAGVRIKNEDIKSIPDLIKLADNELYARKNSKKMNSAD